MSRRSGTEAVGAVVVLFGVIIVICAFGLAIDCLYTWLLELAVNATFHTHFGAMHFFWMVVWAGSFISVSAAAAVSSRSKR